MHIFECIDFSIHRQRSADFHLHEVLFHLPHLVHTFGLAPLISEPRAPSEDRDRRRSRSPPAREPSPKPDDDLDGFTEKEVRALQ